MRYIGYYLSGHARKVEHGVMTDEDCWKDCLQETSFNCLSVAYAATSQSCELYDKKALMVYMDWTNSSEFTYYEYCVNGELQVLVILIFLFYLRSEIHIASLYSILCISWDRLFYGGSACSNVTWNDVWLHLTNVFLWSFRYSLVHMVG